MHAARPPGSSTGQASRVHYEGHRPEQTTLYHLFQQHAASFVAHTEASTGAELPRFAKEEFDAFLECSILAHGFLRLRCGIGVSSAAKAPSSAVKRLAARWVLTTTSSSPSAAENGPGGRVRPQRLMRLAGGVHDGLPMG